MTSTYTERLIDYLKQLDSRGYAVLRRALAESQPHDYIPAFAYLEPFLNEEPEGESSFFRRTVYLFAGLYCLVNRTNEESSVLTETWQNFGYSVGRFHKEKYPEHTYKGQSKDLTSLEQRFLVLLDSDEEQRPYFLRQMLMMLKGEAIHWPQLFNDLQYWSNGTPQRWARQFYKTIH